MTVNRLSIVPNVGNADSDIGYTQHNASAQQITLSQIAERLRLVHSQMKKQTPINNVRNEAKTSVDVVAPNVNVVAPNKEYLNDIARALLAEYYARKKSEQNLIEKLSEIKDLIEQNAAIQNSHIANDRQDLTQKITEELDSRFKFELEQQAKTISRDNQKNNEELLRYLRETTSTSRFAVQLASLEQQILKIQSSLEANKNADISNNSNARQSVSLMGTKIQPDATIGSSSNHRPLLRKLAEQTSIKHNNYTRRNANAEMVGNKFYPHLQPDIKKSAEMISGIRNSRETVKQETAYTIKNQSGFIKKILYFMTMVLAMAVSYGLYLQSKYK